MDIDEKELWDDLQNSGFDMPEIKLIMNCIESAKKPDALAEKVELDEEAIAKCLYEAGCKFEGPGEYFKWDKIPKNSNFGNRPYYESLAKAICAKFRPANVDKLAEVECQLHAWMDVFGTTQLTHAKDRLDVAERKARCAVFNEKMAEDNKRLRLALTKIKNGEYDNAHDPKGAAMIAKQALGKTEGEK